MKILMVLTSHSELRKTGKKTGFWIGEFAAPYYVLADGGAEITLASPKGGQPPIDPQSEIPDAQTAATARFDQDKVLKETLPLNAVNELHYDAVFIRADTGRYGTWPMIATRSH